MGLQRNSKGKTGTIIPWWLWLKFYFDKGLGLTNYGKYFVGLFSIYSLGKNIDITWTILFGVIWMLSCPFVGWLWVRSKLQDAENEIQNMLNPFQREVRKHLNNGKPIGA